MLLRPSLLYVAVLLNWSVALATAGVPVDLSGVTVENGIELAVRKDRLDVEWAIGEEQLGQLVLSLQSESPLIESLSILENDGSSAKQSKSFMKPIPSPMSPLVREANWNPRDGLYSSTKFMSARSRHTLPS